MKHLILTLALLGAAGCSSAPSSQSVAESKEGCHTPLGFIPEGRTMTGYLHQVESRGQRCQQGVLSCENGVWSGAYIYPTCVVSP